MVITQNPIIHLEPYPGDPLFNDVCNRVLSFAFSPTYLYYICLELLQKDPYSRNDFMTLVIEHVLENNNMTDELYATYLTNNPNEKDIVKGVEIDIRYLLDKIMTWFRFNPSVMRLLINSNEYGCKLEVDKLLKVGDESYSLQCKIVKRN